MEQKVVMSNDTLLKKIVIKKRERQDILIGFAPLEEPASYCCPGSQRFLKLPQV